MNGIISIVVPVYNVAPYLKECVSSIINQKYKQLEVILVDDGSTDESSRICDEFAEKDSRIKVIHKKNGGLSDARNAGICIATGDWIGFVDSDDYISENMYDILVSAATKFNADIVMCKFDKFVDKFNYIIKTQEDVQIFHEKELLDFYLKDISNGNITPSVWDRLYKADLVKKYRFETNRTHEDIDFTIKVFEACNIAVLIDDRLYGYRIREGNISSLKNSYRNINDRIYLSEKAYSFLMEKECPNEAIVFSSITALGLMDVYYFTDGQTRKKILTYVRKNRNNIRYAVKAKMLNSKKKAKLLCIAICPRFYGIIQKIRGKL